MIKVNCLYCNKKILRILSRSKGRVYCCQSHKKLFEYKSGILNGAQVTERAHEILREKGHYMRDNTYLVERNPSTSLEARKKISERKLEVNWMTGRTKSKHHNYRGGKKKYRGFNWKNIKLQAKQRDRFCCVKCGITEVEHLWKTGQPLQVDHKVLYRLTKDNSLENLQTLCAKCHGQKEKVELAMTAIPYD